MIPSETFELSPEATKFRTEWMTAWTAMEERRKANEAEGARLDAVSPDQFGPACIRDRKAWRLAAIEIGQAQIKLLQTYKTTWPQMVDKERRRRQAELEAAKEKTIKGLMKGLDKLGFENINPDADFITFHKAVAPIVDQLVEVTGKLGNESFIYGELEERIKRTQFALQGHLNAA